MDYMTQNIFYEHICNLQNNIEDRDLETYLLSLLGLVEKENQDLTADLLLQVLQNAFISEPQTFNSEWLKIVTAPTQIVNTKDIINPSMTSDEMGRVYE